jgi:hypothetical protein
MAKTLKRRSGRSKRKTHKAHSIHSVHSIRKAHSGGGKKTVITNPLTIYAVKQAYYDALKPKVPQPTANSSISAKNPLHVAANTKKLMNAVKAKLNRVEADLATIQPNTHAGVRKNLMQSADIYRRQIANLQASVYGKA